MAKRKKSRNPNGPDPKPKPVRFDLTAGEALRVTSIQSQLDGYLTAYQRAQAAFDAEVATMLDGRGLDAITYACTVRIDADPETDTVALVIEAQ